MKSVDLAIVGGSFAGLSCGLNAAKNGLKTQLFERKKSIGEYTQSTGIFVKEIAEKINLPEKLTQKISGIRLYSPNLTHIDLFSPDYYFLATNTCHVLQHMADLAENAGVTIQTATNIRQAYQNNHEVILPQQAIKASYLIGADGAQSQIAKLFQLQTKKQRLLGSEIAVADLPGLNPNVLHVFLDSEIAPGYIGWIVPGVEHIQIGLACHYPHRPNLSAFLKKISALFSTDQLEILEKRGGFIPSGGISKPFACGNVCLLGDAAGMVSPLTAGGIHPAIELGERLADLTFNYLKQAGPLPQNILQNELPSYRFKRLMRFSFNHFSPSNKLYNWVLSKKSFQRFSQLVFFHHEGLFSPNAWRDILRKDYSKLEKTD